MDVPAADALIASDLLYHGCHPWLAEHGTARWLEQLDAVEREHGGRTHVFAGHGEPGDAALFAAQRRYIANFRERIAAVARDGAVPPDELARLAAELRAAHPGWPLDGLIEMNADAVAREVAGG